MMKGIEKVIALFRMMNIYSELSGILTTYYVMFTKPIILESVRERIKRTARQKYASYAREVITNSKTEYSIQNNIFFCSSPASNLPNSIRWHHI